LGETRVDLLHLLEDLRDAYPGSTEETILTEIVANALDSGATTIAITTDAVGPALTIADDGSGMRRKDLARYHDIASSTKVRGAGIGFAGVGIKIALLVCAEVVTETRKSKHHVASSWRLGSRHKAPWRWIPPPGLVLQHGTAVRLTTTSPLSPLLDAGFIEGVLRRNFQPLLDPALVDTLRAHYPRGVMFMLNGERLEAEPWPAAERAPIAIHMARKRKPVGAGYLVREASALDADLRGVAVSTFGKVIKRGWDWLGVWPATPERLGGIIEVPGLAECLTLNKADFIRAGGRAAVYLGYRKAIQEAVSRQLAAWGQGGEPAERARRRAARPVERDLESVLGDLADDFPLLASLVEQRAGGQRRLPVVGARGPGPPTSGDLQFAAAPAPGAVHTTPSDEPSGGSAEDAAPGTAGVATVTAPTERGSAAGEPGPMDRASGQVDENVEEPVTGHVVTGPRARRRARYGLSIEFEERPDDPELGRLVESSVWVNEAHPAFRRAAASRSEGYHIALAVALALAPLAVDPAKEHAFVVAFLERWGSALHQRQKARRR
jgi:hypothetical protein